MRLLILLATFSLLACQSIPRPKGDICVFDAPRGLNKCFDMEKDYSSEGKLKKDAVMKKKPFTSIDQFDKHTNFDPGAWAELVAYKKKLQEAYEAKMKDCR